MGRNVLSTKMVNAKGYSATQADKEVKVVAATWLEAAAAPEN